MTGGRMSLAPHLSREQELAPAAASGRFGVVMDRAAAFETQNQASRDVHWYRAWRASAMIGLGQIDQALALLDQVLSDLSKSAPAPAQADRLRAFIYDLRAKAAVAQNRHQDALADLERSFSLANEVELETNGECDRSLMLAARARQLSDVAGMAGDGARAESAKIAMDRQLEKFTKCLAERDYPGMVVVESLSRALSSVELGRVAAAPVVAPAPAQQPQTSPPVKSDPKRSEPAIKPPPVTQEKPPPDSAPLATVRAQYAPVDPAPWKAAIESVLALGQKHAPNLRADVVIRTDGQHHALRLRAVLPRYSNPAELVPLFRSTVVFFEQVRAIEPKVDRVLVVVEASSGTTQIVASRADVLELFQDRLDAAAFVKKLIRVL